MKKSVFTNPWLPYLLLLPQMAIIGVFFFLPAGEAIYSSFFIEDPFFGNKTWVGMDNYVDAVSKSDYQRTAWFTVAFTAAVAFFSLGFGLMLAYSADSVLRGQGPYKTLLMWVYAIAPPVAGLIAIMLFDQHIGPLVNFVALFGWDMRVGVSYFDTAVSKTVIAVWKQIPYTFNFSLSGLRHRPIPLSPRGNQLLDHLCDAAVADGGADSAVRRSCAEP